MVFDNQKENFLFHCLVAIPFRALIIPKKKQKHGKINRKREREEKRVFLIEMILMYLGVRFFAISIVCIQIMHAMSIWLIGHYYEKNVVFGTCMTFLSYAKLPSHSIARIISRNWRIFHVSFANVLVSLYGRWRVISLREISYMVWHFVCFIVHNIFDIHLIQLIHLNRKFDLIVKQINRAVFVVR